MMGVATFPSPYIANLVCTGLYMLEVHAKVLIAVLLWSRSGRLLRIFFSAPVTIFSDNMTH